MVSQPSLYDWKTESTLEKWLGRIAAWNDRELAAETKKDRKSKRSKLSHSKATLPNRQRSLKPWTVYPLGHN